MEIPRYRFRKGVPLFFYPKSCALKPFVTRKFLKKNNLTLVDIKCKHSYVSTNCGVRSSLTFACRKGFVFSDKSKNSISTCNGEWSKISACVPGIFIIILKNYYILISILNNSWFSSQQKSICGIKGAKNKSFIKSNQINSFY